MPNMPEGDVYADVYTLNLGALGATLTLGVTPANHAPNPMQPPPMHQLVTVRMSLETTKLLAMALRQALTAHERIVQHLIYLPDVVYQASSVAPDDWPPLPPAGFDR